MTLNEQFELIDQLLESGELKLIDDKLYAECDNLDELLEGILSKLVNKARDAKANKQAKKISDAALNTDENKQDSLNKKAEKVKNKLMDMSKKGKQDRVNKVLTKANNSINNVTSTANQVSKMTVDATAAKKALVDSNQKTKELVGSNNIVPKKVKKEKVKKDSNTGTDKPGYDPSETTGGGDLEEALVLKMPEDIIIIESNNYNFFLEQVLEYNGFKVNENNIAVLAKALENGHATIE